MKVQLVKTPELYLNSMNQTDIPDEIEFNYKVLFTGKEYTLYLNMEQYNKLSLSHVISFITESVEGEVIDITYKKAKLTKGVEVFIVDCQEVAPMEEDKGEFIRWIE